MVQHAGTDYFFEAPVQFLNPFNRQLYRLKIGQFIRLFEFFRLMDAGGTDIDADNSCIRKT